MALNTGINSLDAGAPGVRLTGDQRPQKESIFNVPEEMKMADIDNLPPWFLENLQDLLLDYEGDIGQPPQTLNDLEKWYRNKHGARLPEKGITAAAQGGRMGLKGGQLVKPGPGRPGYNGWESSFSRDWGGGGASQGSPPGSWAPPPPASGAPPPGPGH